MRTSLFLRLAPAALLTGLLAAGASAAPVSPAAYTFDAPTDCVQCFDDPAFTKLTDGVLGKAVAKLGEAFGMKVLFSDYKGTTGMGPLYTPFADVLRMLDERLGITFVTVNDISKLDPAVAEVRSDGSISRPGRIDYVVYVGVADKHCFKVAEDVP